ncbi:MAG: translocation protein TolB [Bryobacteraceae bacterium]
MKRLWLGSGILAMLAALSAQQSDVVIKLTQGERPIMAIPDFRGAGAAAGLMAAFNETLWSDIESSGLFKMASKSMYPLNVPQQPSDLTQPPPPEAPSRTRRGRTPPPPTSGGGRWLQDWAGPPVNANYLVMGYTAAQNDVLVLYGWLLNAQRENAATAQMLGKRYFGSLDENGARKIAHEFAADIIGQFGGQSLLNTKIYFISNRTGHKELWSMDPDGSNQKQITRFNSLTIQPAVAPDGSKVACVSYAQGNPAIFVLSVATGGRLPFYNQRASVNGTPDFTPDGKQIVYSSSASGWTQIYVANVNGTDFRRLSNVRAVEVEPKVNPKTGSEIVFVSGRSGPQQIYRMNMDGANVERLTPGEGEASNPSWHPDGQIIAYSWTRGYATGNFNIFVMDVATRNYTQLTHGAGRNENPSWAPDGRHIVFASTRTGSSQIWTMLANGQQLRQLTSQGSNWSPVWGKTAQ